VSPEEEIVLRKLWRRGISEIQDIDLVQYCEERDFDLQRIVPRLCAAGLLTSYAKRHFDKNAVFLIVTSKAKAHFYALETPRWQALLSDWSSMLQSVEKLGIPPRVQQARDLYRQLGTMKEAGKVMGISTSQVSVLCNRYERLERFQGKFEQTVRDFLDGTTPFEKLSFSVLGRLSVRLANGLFSMEIETVPQLMEMNCRRFLLHKNNGRKSLNELREVLRRFDTELEPFGWPRLGMSP
jgi:hypothetical protein